MAHYEAGRCLVGDLRRARGWTQQHLSLLTGIPVGTIGSLEHNRYIATLVDAYALTKVFDCELDDLYIIRKIN